MRLLAASLVAGSLIACSPSPPQPSSQPLAEEPAGQSREWPDVARAFLARHPDEGLAHLLRASERLDTEACVRHGPDLDAILQSGWTGQHPAIASLIQTQRSALDEALAAAQADDIAFPPMESFEDPVPNLLQVQMIAKVLAAEALRMQASGQPNEAAHQALLVVRLGDHLRAEGAPLIQHLVGIALQRIALKTLEMILRDPGLTQEALLGLQTELEGLDERQVSIAEALRTESRLLITNMRRAAENPSLREQELAETSDPALRRAAEEALGSFPAFEAEHGRLWGVIIANAERPAWQRERLDQSWVQRQTANPLLFAALPNFLEVATRADVLTAHLRLCRVLVSLRRGELGFSWIPPDPFDGQPMRLDAERAWSIGPDGLSQGAQVIYDPTNGTVSAGDIVAQLR